MINQAPDIIMWVGSKFYPTADDYIREALNLGCCKRVPMLPREIVPGKSRCFLAHDDGHKGQGRIFAFFVISGVEVILDDEDKITQYQKEYDNLNIQAVSSTQVVAEPRRLCGQRIYGARYVVSESNMEEVYDVAEPLADKLDIQGSIAILLQPIPYPKLRFRGWQYLEPEYLEKYGWPQMSLPVKRTVKIQHKDVDPKSLPLLAGLES